jgi:hypothetical protein
VSQYCSVTVQIEEQTADVDIRSHHSISHHTSPDLISSYHTLIYYISPSHISAHLPSSPLYCAGMMIEEPFQRALKLEVFANTIRRDLSDLLHVSDVCPVPLNITSEALGKT